ncbi:MAG: DUF4157 domain-containing protein [Myxococcota bacterium]
MKRHAYRGEATRDGHGQSGTAALPAKAPSHWSLAPPSLDRERDADRGGKLPRRVASVATGEPVPTEVASAMARMGRGQPLPGSIAGPDLSNVRVHRSPAARTVAALVGARSIAFGCQVVLGQEGDLEHELGHVRQQRAEGVATIDRITVTPDKADMVYRAWVAEYEKRLGKGNPLAAEKAAARTRAQIGPPMPSRWVAPHRRPPPPPPKPLEPPEPQFKVTLADGTELVLSQRQLDARRQKARKELERRIATLETLVRNGRSHQRMLAENKGVGGWLVDSVTGARLPPESMWDAPGPTIQQAKRLLAAGNYKGALKAIKAGHHSYAQAAVNVTAYLDEVDVGGHKLIEYLETTRDISFSVAIATGAVVAAPVVAVGLAEVGVTGAVGTVATGAVVTAGGGIAGGGLRGGTALVGQVMTTGTVDTKELKDETVEGAKRGAVDAFGSVTGYGVTQGLGTGTTLLGRVGVGAASGAAGGGGSAVLDAKLRGKNWKQALEDGQRGAFLGAVSGGVAGPVGGAKMATAPRALTEGVVAGGTTVGIALAEGKDIDEQVVKDALGSGVSALGSGAVSLTTTSRRPPSSPVPAEGHPAVRPNPRPANHNRIGPVSDPAVPRNPRPANDRIGPLQDHTAELVVEAANTNVAGSTEAYVVGGEPFNTLHPPQSPNGVRPRASVGDGFAPDPLRNASLPEGTHRSVPPPPRERRSEAVRPGGPKGRRRPETKNDLDHESSTLWELDTPSLDNLTNEQFRELYRRSENIPKEQVRPAADLAKDHPHHGSGGRRQRGEKGQWPANASGYVYQLIDFQGRVIYIGITVDPARRIQNHANPNNRYSKVFYGMQILRGGLTEVDARALEARFRDTTPGELVNRDYSTVHDGIDLHDAATTAGGGDPKADGSPVIYENPKLHRYRSSED